MASGSANVVEILVKATNDTAGGFDSAKAGADSAGESMDTYAASVDRATEAQARFDEAQAEQSDAAARVAELLQEDTAAADELSAAEARLTEASLESADARKTLADAEADVAAKAKIAADEQVESGVATEESAATSGGALAGMGSKVKMAFLGTAVGMGVAIKAAMDYQEQSTQLVTGAGELKKNLGMVQQGMLALSAQTATSTGQMQSGMYLIESAGYHGGAALDVLKASAEGAKVGNADLGTVANATTTVLTDYKMSATQAASATSGLVEIVASGKTHMEDLASSMSKVLPTAAALKVSFPEVGGALATMTSQGVSAKNAAMELNTTMISMAAPTKVQTAAMKEVGLTSSQVAKTLTHQGLIAAIQEVTDAAGKKFPPGSAQYVAALNAMLGGHRGLQVALALSGKNMRDFKANTDAVSQSMRDGKKDVQGWAETQKDASFQVEQAKDSIKAMGIELGMALLPAFQAILKPLDSFLEMLTRNKAAAITFATIIGGVLAGALGGKLVRDLKDAKEGFDDMVTGVTKLLGKLGILTTAQEAQTAATEEGAVAQGEMDAAMDANPIGAIILLIVGLIAIIVLLVTHFKDVKQWAKDAFNAVKDAVTVAFHAVEDAVMDVIGFIKRNWVMIVGIMLGPLGLAAALIYKNWKEIEDAAKDAWHDIVSILKSAWDGIKEGVADLVGFIRSYWWVLATILATLLLGPIAGLTVFIATHWAEFTRLTGELVNNVTRFFEQLPGRIMSAISSLPSLLFNAGANIISGLVNGLESMIGSVGSVMSNIAGEITSHLPFSPAKKGPLSGQGDPTISGRKIAQMLSQGMVSGLPSVANAANRLAGGAVIGGAGHGVAGAGGGPITLNITGSDSSVVKALVLALRREIRIQGGNVQQVLGH